MELHPTSLQQEVFRKVVDACSTVLPREEYDLRLQMCPTSHECNNLTVITITVNKDDFDTRD
jgi:hypothetical protein